MRTDTGLLAAIESPHALRIWRQPVFRRSVLDGAIVGIVTLAAGFFSFTFGMGETVTNFVQEFKQYQFDQLLVAQIALGMGFIFFGIRRLIDLYNEVLRRISVESLADRLVILDSLTGLPNRAHFLDEINRSMARAERTKGFIAALIINIRSFSSVNDGIGRAAGDLLLVEFAKKLTSIARSHESLARLEADNFGIIMEFARDDDTNSVKTAVQRVWDALNGAMRVEGVSFDLKVNIGAALYPHDAADAQTLLRFADAAMRKGKLNGNRKIVFFERKAGEKLRERAELQLELKQAIESGMVAPWYQPLVDLQNGSLAGYEILARWHHAERGIISPDKFIPIAEASGMMTDLTLSLLEAACRGWKANRLTGCLALNVSPKDLRNPWFSERLLATLTKGGFPASHLEVEITENSIIEDLAASQRAILSLKNQGVKIVLDDFGAGYSNLSQLSALRIDKIKIDRLFISTMMEDKTNMVVVKTIVGLGKVMQIPVLAEGIETPEQADLLRSMGCDFGQGYLFSKPVATDELSELSLPNINALSESAGETGADAASAMIPGQSAGLARLVQEANERAATPQRPKFADCPPKGQTGTKLRLVLPR